MVVPEIAADEKALSGMEMLGAPVESAGARAA